MKITRLQREFIGEQFHTPKGGTLTVTGVSPIKQGRGALFTVECSVCSADAELWPSGSIIASKGHLIKGVVPCGCTRSPRWTQDQFEILVKRKCEEKGYIFQGFVGEYKGAFTYLRLHNLQNDNTWETTTITSFLHIGTGCPLEARLKQKQQAV
ncbi:TPA: hypothetical protein LNG45_003469 [Vibrio cholerae]|uniref:CapR homology domain-containing protein n=1 Tax=Vibrio cholerae serotype O1 biovar El Tor TaxID=686 RepID=A0A1Z2R917_VIBCE|nr:hypothetical protein [Vibrio cholerae O1 biovar El Tor]HAS2514412.1 hypothetical protein [Vibrio cholerae]HAS3849994.1 hypothetical protein [Vibrio cholerae]HAS3890292.1 hypothetical protein [Vibrio cholerae]HBC0429605.1 hypothetical protein [Vibrio cholerae]